MHALAQRVLHFSPEPSVIVKLIDSAAPRRAALLGEEDEAVTQAVRFKATFPREYSRWIAGLPLADDAAE